MNKLRPPQRRAWVFIAVTAAVVTAAIAAASAVALDQRDGVVEAAVLLVLGTLAGCYSFRSRKTARFRDKALAALLTGEAQYRNTFDNVAVGVAHASVDGRFARCNQRLCEMLGYSAEELRRMTIDELTHPQDRAGDLSLRQRLLTGEIPTYRTEKRYVCKNGEPLWARVNASVARDAAGEVDYLVAVIEDIHLNKLTRMTMRALNSGPTGDALLRLMTRTLATLLHADCAFVGVATALDTHRMDARATWVDGEFAPDFSYALEGTPCEGVGGDQPCIYGEQVQRRFPADAMLAAMGIESYAGAALGAARTGTPPLGILAVMWRRPLRQSDAVQALLPMVALRLGAELAREREARKFQDLFHNAPSAIFLIDAQGIVRMSSGAGEHLFGWAPQALIGEPLECLFPAEHAATYRLEHQRFVEAQRTGLPEQQAQERCGRRRNGSSFPVQMELRTLDTAEGRFTVAYVQDITERKQAEAALQCLNAELEDTVQTRTVELMRARDDAEQANRAKSAFLAAMSHEIRTPMNGVVGMIDVLAAGHLRSEQVGIVKTIRESAYALLTIVDDVLDFSKIEAGAFQVDNEPMDASSVVEGVCDTLDHLAGKKGVELTLFTAPALPPRVLGDAARLRQVLLNLVGNAIKFSSSVEREGRVGVRVRVVQQDSEPARLEFSVSDNGVGMDGQTLSRLFTPFTQADAGSTRRFGGTGLGLSISHRLVELMGGEIAVRSEPGRGSTFTVCLPLESLASELIPATEARALAGLRCLVFGDERTDDLVAYLAHAGAVVQRVVDLAAARQWLHHCEPGRWIVVVAGAADGAMDPALDELRGECRERTELDVRFVVVERGRRSVAPQRVADRVSLKGSSLHRSVFVSCVAGAAQPNPAPACLDEPFDAATLAAAPSALAANPSVGMILVAEDDEVNQMVVRQQLALLGFTADVCRTGSDALECWRRGNYALLLTDLHMPQMDGYELAMAIRAAEAGRRHMPIVALTANALKGEAKHCLAMGMDDYMTKPVQMADLKRMLRKWMPVAAEPAPERLPAPHGRTAVANALALDVNVLEALVGNEPDVIKELLQDFRFSAEEAAVQMRRACRAHDAAAVEGIAHKLKSSARSVGALALGDLCVQMEQAGQAAQFEALSVLWPRFEAAMVAVEAALSVEIGSSAMHA